MAGTDYDVIVVGAGASGSVAALVAAQPRIAFEQEMHLPQVPKRILLLEGQDKVAKKILATGNGRCNLGNMQVSSSEYSSNSPVLLSSILRCWTPEQSKRFFHKCGVSIAQEEGRLYPRSNRAESVRYALEQKLRQARVEVHTDETVILTYPLVQFASGESQYQQHYNPYHQPSGRYRFGVQTNHAHYRCRYLVLACGGYVQPSAESLAGTGFTLADPFDLRLGRTPKPALAGLLVDRPYVFLSGVRAQATLQVWKGRYQFDPFTQSSQENIIDSSKGEVQFTRYGLSGIPAMCVSRSIGKSRTWATLDLFPDQSPREVLEMLMRVVDGNIEFSMLNWGTTLLHTSLCKAILLQLLHHPRNTLERTSVEACLRGETHSFSMRFFRRLVGIAKCFPLEIIGTKGYEHAQVMHGGFSLSQFRPGTLESTRHPGLYVIGEILDVDGICGGYNLHWAWSSGVCAGKDIAERLVCDGFH